jgi:hypothetical protein
MSDTRERAEAVLQGIRPQHELKDVIRDLLREAEALTTRVESFEALLGKDTDPDEAASFMDEILDERDRLRARVAELEAITDAVAAMDHARDCPAFDVDDEACECGNTAARNTLTAEAAQAAQPRTEETK